MQLKLLYTQIENTCTKGTRIYTYVKIYILFAYFYYNVIL
jgi:hypothetical protein